MSQSTATKDMLGILIYNEVIKRDWRILIKGLVYRKVNILGIPHETDDN